MCHKDPMLRVVFVTNRRGSPIGDFGLSVGVIDLDWLTVPVLKDSCLHSYTLLHVMTIRQ